MNKKYTISLLLVIVTNVYIKALQPPSLANCRNSCFINASIQALYNASTLTNILIDYQKLYKQLSTADLYCKLVNEIKKKEQSNDTATFKCNDNTLLQRFTDNIWVSLFKVLKCSQQDAQEFINKFIDALINDQSFDTKKITAEKQSEQQYVLLKNALINKIRSVVYFEQTTKTTCPQKDTYKELIREINEKYNGLMVPVETPEFKPINTLNNCLEYYFQEQKLNDPKNLYFDDKNQVYRSNCVQQYFLKTTPQILIISLNRYGGNIEQSIKLTHRVEVPMTLNLHQFLLDKTKSATDYSYHLTGIVIQSGTIIGGHYWAYVKKNINNQDQWFKCDDATITKVDIASAQVKNEIEGTVKATGYVLVYEKISTTTSNLTDVLINLSNKLNALVTQLL